MKACSPSFCPADKFPRPSLRFASLCPMAACGFCCALLLFMAAIAPASASASAAGSASIRSLYDLSGRKVATNSGTVFQQVFTDLGINAEFTFYDIISDAITALRNGKVDAYIMEDTILQMVISSERNLRLIPPVSSLPIAFAVRKQDEAFALKADAALKALKASGEVERIWEKWITPSGPGKADKTVPQQTLPQSAPVLRLGVEGETVPFTYVAHGKPVGFEVEVSQSMAHALGMRLEIVVMNFSALLPALVSGRVDMTAGGMSVTPERAESVRFLEPLISSGMAAIVRDEGGSAAGSGAADTPSFWAGMKRSFERNLIEEQRWRMLLAGIQETIIISLASLMLGTALGAGVCALRRSKNPVPRYSAAFFIRAIQGTPIVVLLMIFYYILLAKVQISGTVVAIIAFSCNFAAYTAEIFRTSLDALDKGQQEAATALGFTRWQTFSRVVLPQAAQIALPVFKGEFISMVKMTSVVGYIAVQDLTKMSDLIRSRTYEPFFPLILTAVIYFGIASLLVMVLNRIEATIDPQRRKRHIAGVRMDKPSPPSAQEGTLHDFH